MTQSLRYPMPKCNDAMSLDVLCRDVSYDLCFHFCYLIEQHVQCMTNNSHPKQVFLLWQSNLVASQ